jgi:hypothetical protein
MSDLKNHVADMLNEFTQEETRAAKMREWIAQLPEDQLLDAMKAVNPYGVTLPVKSADVETVSISYTNMRLEFMKRLVTTGMIGFVMKMLKEYKTPDEVAPVDVGDYLADPTIIDPPAYIKDKSILAKYQEYRDSMAERVAIWNFFTSIFDFDPDRHVTSAMQTNTKDPTRACPDTAAVRRAIMSEKNTIRKTVKRADYEAGVADLKPVTDATEVEKAAYGVIPPLDLFAKFDRYLEEHYEEYMGCVAGLYGATPDIDFCLIVYDKHDNAAAAKTFKERYMEQVIAPITNITKNRWVALGPYRENREKLDFFNRHTEVLKEMIDQRERDSHVATDIMKKRIKTKKAQNIAEAGPDDKEFLKYLKANKPEISRMGGEHIRQDNIAEEDDQCPDDAVEVNVFTLEDGGREMKVHKIYNPVEAPTSGGAPTE